MFNKSLLAELIDQAVEDCYSYGSGRAEDEEMGTELVVLACWRETDDPEYSSIIEIGIYQGGILKICYEDPNTKCN